MGLEEVAGPERVASPDGTPIAFWWGGAGPPVLLVHGAMSDHRRWRIAPLLQPRHTVYTMDRRGRGGSGDAQSWALQREVEDVAAVIAEVARRQNSQTDLLGHSLGGLLSLRASAEHPDVRRLVLYEPAINEAAQPEDLRRRMQQFIDTGHPEDATRIMLREVVHMPEHEVAAMEALPSWPSRVAAAHTLPRELGVPLRWDPSEGQQVKVPTLLILGADSPDVVQQGTRLVAEAVPDSTLVVLEGQQHIADQLIPEEFAGIVSDFLQG